jgi:hypothetical protein
MEENEISKKLQQEELQFHTQIQRELRREEEYWQLKSL